MKIRADMNVIGEDNLLAVGNVYLDELIVIHDVKVITKKDDDGEDISFVVMPSRKKDDSWEKVVWIKDKDLYSQIDKAVMEAVDHAARKDIGAYDLKVDIRPYVRGDTRAYATLIFNDAVQIENVRIVQAGDDLKVYYPFEKRDGVAQNLAGPATLHMKRMLDADIIQAYDAKMKALDREKETAAEKGKPSDHQEKDASDTEKKMQENKKREVSR